MDADPEGGESTTANEPNKHIEWTKEFNELRQKDRSGLSRFCA